MGLIVTRVFISYSHKDEELKNRLEVHLAPLKRSGAIDAWHDRRIVAGDEFTDEIDENLERADIVLLLISPDFLNSKYCYDIELRRAMERHDAGDARVIPIILHHCDWRNDPLRKLQALPTDGRPIVTWSDSNEAFLNVVNQIKVALSSPKSKSDNVVADKCASDPGQRPEPRSNNLRVNKRFTEAERDRICIVAFEYMCKFFENSLADLSDEHPDLETSYRKVDGTKFTAVIYRNGEAVSRCRVKHGGVLGNGIFYSFDDRAGDNSYNESISAEAGPQGLYFCAAGMPMMTRGKIECMSVEDAAEYYWSLLMEPLQRGPYSQHR